MGISKFTAHTAEEMIPFKGYIRNTNENKVKSESFLEKPKVGDYAKTLDWRNTKGVVTAVKD